MHGGGLITEECVRLEAGQLEASVLFAIGASVTEVACRPWRSGRRVPWCALESVGFGGAPRFLGVDAAGREVLTFMEGEVAGKPRPAWLADEGRLASVGRLVRAYDDAVSGLVVPEGVIAGRPVAGADVPPAPPYPKGLIGHADFTPDNIVKPATRVDEVYNAMLYWVPLMDPVDRDEPLRDADAARRARILADVYGMTELDRARLLEAAVLWTRRSWHGMKSG